MNVEIGRLLSQLIFPGLLCFIFLTAFIFADKTFPDKILRITMHALLCGFVLLITDSVNYYFEAQQTHTTLRLIMLACSFTFKIGCSGCCVVLSQRQNPTTKRYLYIVIFVNAIISFVSIPTGCVFSIGPDYSVVHGPLYIVPYLATIFNCTVLMITGIKNFKTNPGETTIIFAMVISPFIATYLEVIHGFKCMIPLSFIICVIFYFMCLNVQLYRRDTLTQLLNRRSFFMDAKRRSNKKMIVLSMDLNNLKYYNDTFGHAAGDLAITTSTACMQKAFSKAGVVYRTGGDEFMALFVNKSEEEVNKLIENFKAILGKTEYMVACGTSVYTPGNNFEDIVAESDARMYKDKIAYKKRAAVKAVERNPEIGLDKESIENDG